MKEAADLDGIGAKPGKKKIQVEIPEGLEKALSKSSGLKMYFEKLAPSHRREYVEYIADAKQDEIRERRVRKVIEMIAENKKLHEKHEKKNKYKR
jgi:uncharacterized protein YdeI (YjbR/CyaY-like superfamily)